MREYADEAWSGFPAILREYMTGPRPSSDQTEADARAAWWARFPGVPRSDDPAATRTVTIAELAGALGVDPADIANWRHARSRPSLRLLPEIAIEVGKLRGDPNVDPALLLRAMWVLPQTPSPQELVSTALQVHKLELKLADARAALREFSRTSGAASVVAAAQRSGRWSVAVWPAYEGPEGFKLHVADRLDFEPLDPTDHRPLWDDAYVRPALRAVYATLSRGKPRWDGDHLEEDEALHWAIHHIAAPRSPVVARPWPGLDSISCYAISEDAWVHDVGALVAMTIGYGLTTTRDLAIDMHGVMDGVDGRADRIAAAMQDALAAVVAEAPRRRVWTHHGVLAAPRLAIAPAFPAGHGCVPVWLRETDAYLDELDPAQREGVRRARTELDAVAATSPPLITIDVDHIPDRHARWERVLRDVTTILTELTDRGLPHEVGAYRAIRERLATETGVGDVLLRWLTSHPAGIS